MWVTSTDHLGNYRHQQGGQSYIAHDLSGGHHDVADDDQSHPGAKVAQVPQIVANPLRQPGCLYRNKLQVSLSRE